MISVSSASGCPFVAWQGRLKAIHIAGVRLFKWISVLGVLCATAFEALSAEPRSLWEFTAGDAIQSSPAIGPDGIICFGSDDGRVQALSSTGSLLWSFKTGASIAASPAIADDGTIYVASTDRVLYSFSPDGKLKWLQSPGGPIAASPAVLTDGGVVVATVFNTVVAYGSSGTKRWDFRAGGNIVSSPAVGADGTIYFGCKDNVLYALSSSGRLKWRYTAKGNFNASPAIGSDGTIYIGSLDGEFHAVSAGGIASWVFKASDAIRSSVAIGSDGNLFFGCDDKQLYAVGNDGKLKWRYATGGQVRSSPAVTEDGLVYVGSYDQKLHAVGADGAKLWEFPTGGYVSASPNVRPDGSVVFGSWDKRLRVLDAKSALAKSPWAKFRGGEAQTGGLPADLGATRVSFLVVTDRQVVAPALVKMVATITGRDRVASKVEFFNGNQKLGEVFSEPYAWTWPDVPAGEYTLSAKVTMLSGQTLTASQVKLAVKPGLAMAAPKPLPKLTGAPDKTSPRVVISSPLTETRFEEAELELRGKADDDVKVATVEYRLNDLPFQKASGTTSWSQRVRLRPGDNQLVVRAVDTSGNISAEATKKLYYVLKVPLEVSVVGEGTVRSDQEQRLVEAGTKVTLKALPAKGQVFAGWTGSLTNSTAEIAFTMTEGLRLKAMFVPNPYAILAGEFTGLVTESTGNSLTGVGLLQVSISESGSWSGKLAVGGESFSVKGEFGPGGTSPLGVSRRQEAPMTVALRVNLGGDADLITGVISDGTWSAEVIGDRQVFDGRSTRAPQAGQYTLVITAKDESLSEAMGDGFGALTVDERGVARLSGMLGDGTPLKFESAISKAGVWPVFVPLPGGRTLSGWIRFKGTEDFLGQLLWRGIGETRWQTTVNVLGGLYVPPAKGKAVLSEKNGKAALHGGDLPSSIFESVKLETNQKIVLSKKSGSELALAISPGSGLFTGSFVHPLSGRVVELHGALLQGQGMGTGVFLGPTNAGRVSFTFRLKD